MKQRFEKILNRFSTLFSANSGKTIHQRDLTRLTRQIVAINQKNASGEIINEMADCLKDSLHYKLFAFVIKKNSGADVWLDPDIYKNSMETIILKDLGIESKEALTYLNYKETPDHSQETFNIKDLACYELNEENCCAKLYMLNKKKSSPWQDDLVNLVLQAGAAALSKQVKIEILNKAAVIDPLTGCYNRREFEKQLKGHIANARRYQKNLSLFIFDLDHFKLINDTHGHLGGDRVLREVSSLVKNNIRQGDILARYGGEEFVVVLPETDKINAIELADRIRAKIAGLKISHNDARIHVNASFGVSELTPDADMTRFIEEADTMLYKAKVNGRNRVMPGLIKVLPDRKTSQKEENLLSACHNF